LFCFYHVDVDYVVVGTTLDTRLGFWFWFWFEVDEGVGGVEVESIHALLPHIVSTEIDLDNVMLWIRIEWN